MKGIRGIFSVILVVFFFTLSLGVSAFAQEMKEEKSEELDLGSTDTDWVWGEVVSTDIPAGSMLIKYVDYDTDMENNMLIYVNSATAYENAGSLEEIVPQDMVSVDFTVSAEGKNIAQNIDVEKLDDPEAKYKPVQESKE